MTAATLQRCTACGRHRALEDYAKGRRQCRGCVNERRRAQRAQVAAPPEAASPLAGRAQWHRCEGIGVYAAHIEEHRAGFWTEGYRAVAFIEQFCVYPDGEKLGQPFLLLDWQRELLLGLFRLREEGLRQYRRALVGVPKKNAKSALAAALALYFTVADGEPTPFVPCAAANEDQADIVFGFAKAMCEESPPLKELTEVFDREIVVPSRPGAKLVRVAAGGGHLDGRNVYVPIFDELHEWTTAKSQATYTVLTKGTVARRQPLIFAITTAGWDKDSICGQLYEHGRRVEAGEVEDSTLYFAWWEAPEHLDYGSQEAFLAANPSAGATVTYERFREEVLTTPEHEVRRYNLNQWTSVEAAWLPPGAWGTCERSSEIDPGAEIVVAIDAATKHDSTAVVLVQEQGEQAAVRSRVWERPIDPVTAKPRADWRLPIEELKTYLRELHRKYDVRAFGYDPAFISWVADELEAEGLPMVEIPQTAGRMVPASQGLYERVVQQRIVHDGDPTLARHIANAVAVQSATTPGWRLAKGKARRPMDAAIALAMCVYLLGTPEEEPAKAPHLWMGDESDDAYDDR